MRNYFVVFLAVLWAPGCCSCWAAASIDLAVGSPYQPAKKLSVRLRGDALQGATELWTSFPGRAFRETAAPGSGGEIVYTLFVPVELPAGIGALRVGTTNGPSDLQLLMLDELPSVSKQSSTYTMAEAQELKLPVTVDGYGKELGSDYFKVNLAKGARISVEIVAHRLGSPFDPVLRLLDEDGRELAYCDDAPGAAADARLSYQCAQAGIYYIELRDTRYQGGPKFFYRLRAGDFAPAPIPFLPLDQEHSRFDDADLMTVKESEPNDQLAVAMKLSTPVRVAGGFAKLRDQDFYAFEAAKGERLVFEGKSRSLGFSCDLFMQLLRTNGSVVVEANVTGAAETALTNQFGEAGTYVLMVEELTRRGGPDLGYHLEIRPLAAGFDLSVEADSVVAQPGGTFELKVTCARREFNGPITLRTEGLGDGFTMSNNLLGEKTNSIALKVTAPADLPAGRLWLFAVVGEAEIGERTFVTRASTMPALRKHFALMLYPPRELDGLIALGITPVKREERPPEQASAKP